ncbi:ribosomal RNA processing protein 36 homolog [Corticium candelabrum]|uniref:ribosomal RNA processing protein 36 homolog n=1 Tax=Corticium candelabrum TaxID=121492 RepID=UPI002E25F235|nr:ribosomal RNA processing protein 36 homolog [Corticium candelabrum]
MAMDTCHTVKLKQELGDIPLGELQRMRDAVSAKRYCESVYERPTTDTETKLLKPKREENTFKRASKNRPREMSSKKPVSRFRTVVDLPKKVVRDPRFEEESGHFNAGLFHKAYSFIDEYKAIEKQALERELKKTRKKSRREDVSALLQKMEKEETARARAEESKKVDRELRKNERKLIGKGKHPYYLKNSARKKLKLAERFLELKTKGKLEHFLLKRRKRTATKERRFLPFRRQKQVRN